MCEKAGPVVRPFSCTASLQNPPYPSASGNKMPWPQIYDGKFWQASLAQTYEIHSIPRPILVDGDTGLILAEGTEARGRHLAPAIEKALAAKKKN